MTPQTESIALSTTPFIFRVTAYNANTLILHCTGTVTPFTTLKAELHGTTDVGQTPLAEEIYDGVPGAGPHELTFSVAKMNQLPAGTKQRNYTLVVLGQMGSGDSVVKSVLANVNLILLAAPCGSTAPPPPSPATYATTEELAAIETRVAALEDDVGTSTVRVMSATLLLGQSAVVVTLATGETICSVMPQRSDAGVLLQGVDYSGLNATLQFTGVVDANLSLLLLVQTA